MANKDTLQTPKEVLLSRLKVFLEKLNEQYQSTTSITELDLIAAYEEAINLFLSSTKNLDLQNFLYFKPGLPADPTEYNYFTSLVQLNLQALFSEIASLDRLVSANFNSLLSEREQVLQTSKRISNKLGNYLLYADPNLGAGYFFGDSFNTTNHIESGSSLVETEECFHSVEEGSILLPIKEESRPEIKKVLINKRSNGTKGNNFQLGKSGHDNIEALFDNEPNTWFEYEKVSSSEEKNPLVLDITICLKEVSVINHININPLHFGTPTAIEIERIETSKDGEEYFSIKDEVPIKDFVSEDEENIFELSPASANHSGIGYYSFLARKAQFIHIVFKQTSPYSIETATGIQLRYAIGVRDINIIGRKFQEEGSIVSTLFSTDGLVRKVSLYASENPKEESILGDISHFLSHDDGATWLQLQPQGRTTFDLPEILNYNTSDSDSIITEDEITSFRHKISIKRNKPAFSGDVVLTEEKENLTEVVSFPSQEENSISLKNNPIKDSVQLLLPFYGSYSSPVARTGSSIVNNSTLMDLDPIEVTVDVSGLQTIQTESGTTLFGIIKYPLPFEGVKNLEHKIRVFLNGSQIEFCPKDESVFSAGAFTSYSSIDENSRVYFLNKGGKEIQFGYQDSNKNQYGFIPPSGSKLTIFLDGDNPSLELYEGKYHLNLSSYSDGDKDSVSLLAVNSVEQENYLEYEIEVPVGNVSFRAEIMTDALGEPIPEEYSSGSIFVEESSGMFVPYFLEGSNNFDIKEYTLEGELISGDQRVFRSKVGYVDGYSEFYTNLGDRVGSRYTFNPKTGTIYLGVRAPVDRKVVLVAKSIKMNKLDSSVWDFYKDPISNRINTKKIILDSKYVFSSKQITNVSVEEAGQKTLFLLPENELGHSWHNKKLVKGTVAPSSSLFFNELTPTEKEYIDGSREFNTVKTIREETISFIEQEEGYLDFVLSKIDSSEKTLVGSPTFSVKRDKDIFTSPVNIFNVDGQKSSFADLSVSNEGDWAIEREGNVYTVRVRYSGTPQTHFVSYRYNDAQLGIDTSNFYSVDYDNAVIYFASPIRNTGTVTYEVSLYSAFYNIAKVIPSNKITDVNEKNISVDSEFLLKFLKKKTFDKLRPNVLKVNYSYNKTSSESLADIEPYFSPICKDVAFRMVDSSLLEEL